MMKAVDPEVCDQSIEIPDLQSTFVPPPQLLSAEARNTTENAAAGWIFDLLPG